MKGSCKGLHDLLAISYVMEVLSQGLLLFVGCYLGSWASIGWWEGIGRLVQYYEGENDLGIQGNLLRWLWI